MISGVSPALVSALNSVDLPTLEQPTRDTLSTSRRSRARLRTARWRSTAEPGSRQRPARPAGDDRFQLYILLQTAQADTALLTFQVGPSRRTGEDKCF